jgi:hypothetical protein
MTLNERPDGTIIIAPRSPSNSIIPPEGDEWGQWRLGLKVSVTRYSIHPSDNSPGKVTTIKHTQILEVRSHTTVMYTRAARIEYNFCQVFFHIGTTCRPGDRVTISTDNILLTAFDGYHTLVYGVFIAPPRAKPLWTATPYMNIRQFEFKRFAIIVMYAFVTYPNSPSMGATMNFTTLGKILEGINALDINRYAAQFMHELKDSYTVRVKPHPLEPELALVAKSAILVRDGSFKSTDYQNWRRMIICNFNKDPLAIRTTSLPILG